MINTINANEITEKHTKFLNRYRMTENEENKCLTQIYWLPKLHKDLSKARLIKATPNFS